MTKYDVRVYNVSAMYKTTVVADNVEDARRMALNQSEVTDKWEKPDTNRVSFDIMTKEEIEWDMQDKKNKEMAIRTLQRIYCMVNNEKSLDSSFELLRKIDKLIFDTKLFEEV